MQQPSQCDAAIPCQDQTDIRAHKGNLRQDWPQKHPPQQGIVEQVQGLTPFWQLIPNLWIHEIRFRIIIRIGQPFIAVMLQMRILEPQIRDENDQGAPLAGFKRIRSSNGDVEKRPYIKTDILMDGITKNIELTLTDRGPMDYTMLIGRKALGRRWMVNPSISFLTKPKGNTK